ncbi:thermostable hemolysin [Pantoea stewartii]|uniref:thermostable hemolysin n=1 Tax=Pantoea stewartii TaxID=66269 RepID=UPI0016287440|nr:thermostable hemolysin [Pantoea stewartii]MBC0856495.1 thermostable hemolysin [Pantoea stewartii]
MSSFLHKQQNIDIFYTRLDIIRRDEDSAEEARQYISNIYYKNYRATINPDPDIIIASRNKDTAELIACTGISFVSATQPLFSERYLSAPLDEIILKNTGHRLEHHQVIEVGSLASDNPHAAADLIRLMPIIAWFMGKKAILCTSTRRLRKLLAFHQVPFCMLSEASPEKLSPEIRAAWGSYYDQAPQTGVILLEQCGHLFNHYCGRLVFSEFEHFARSALSSEQVAA